MNKNNNNKNNKKINIILILIKNKIRLLRAHVSDITYIYSYPESNIDYLL